MKKLVFFLPVYTHGVFARFLGRTTHQGRMQGGGSKGALDPPPKIFSIPRSRYSNRAVTVLEQCVVSYLRIFMYFISDKYVVGEVGSYCQLAVTFLFCLTLPTQTNVVPQFILTPLSISLDPPLRHTAGVTVIYVSPGNVFPAHISLGIRVSPHTYH